MVYAGKSVTSRNLRAHVELLELLGWIWCRSSLWHLGTQQGGRRCLQEEDAGSALQLSCTPCHSVQRCLFTVLISAHGEPWVKQAKKLICNCSISNNGVKYQRLLLTHWLLQQEEALCVLVGNYLQATSLDALDKEERKKKSTRHVPSFTKEGRPMRMEGSFAEVQPSCFL